METIELHDSFNLAHTLSYSVIGLQEMNLVDRFGAIFWNTANLIIDSGATLHLDDDGDEEEEILLLEEEEEEEEVKKKVNKVEYGKIAKAIGNMQKRGIKVHPPNINKSNFTFSPDLATNSIMYGLKGITKVGEKIVEEIIEKRPFKSVEDLRERVRLNKTQMINLIKSGALDALHESGDRRIIMEEFLTSIAETKKTLNLRNANMLIARGMIPNDYEFNKKVFMYNKYIKNKVFKLPEDFIRLDDRALEFYQTHFDLDLLEQKSYGNDVVFCIYSKKWKKIYDSYMLPIKKYISTNLEELLLKLNGDIVKDLKNKYASGEETKWSMDSISFYQDAHELDNIDLTPYGVEDFHRLPDKPVVDYSFTTEEGHEINMFKLTRIAGTVIDRDKNKSEISLLTTSGVVTVKAYGIMPYYDKQISRLNEATGKKEVLEKSWFTRGNKIIVTGIKRNESTFFAKKYKKTPGHHFMLIEDIDSKGNITLREERLEVEQ